MRKCPNCNKKYIKPINIKFLSSSKTVECENCNTKIGSSKKWGIIIGVPYFIFVVVLFVLHLPIDKNFFQFQIILWSSGIIMAGIHFSLIPYEVR